MSVRRVKVARAPGKWQKEGLFHKWCGTHLEMVGPLEKRVKLKLIFTLLFAPNKFLVDKT